MKREKIIKFLLLSFFLLIAFNLFINYSPKNQLSSNRVLENDHHSNSNNNKINDDDSKDVKIQTIKDNNDIEIKEEKTIKKIEENNNYDNNSDSNENNNKYNGSNIIIINKNNKINISDSDQIKLDQDIKKDLKIIEELEKIDLEIKLDKNKTINQINDSNIDSNDKSINNTSTINDNNLKNNNTINNNNSTINNSSINNDNNLKNNNTKNNNNSTINNSTIINNNDNNFKINKTINNNSTNINSNDKTINNGTTTTIIKKSSRKDKKSNNYNSTINNIDNNKNISNNNNNFKNESLIVPIKKKSDKKLILVMDRSLFRGVSWKSGFKKCPKLKCELTYNRTLIDDAVGVLYFLPRFYRAKYNYSEVSRKNSRQLFFAWTMESPSLYSYQNNMTFLNSMFNVTVGYTRFDFKTPNHIYTPYGPTPFNSSDHYVYKHSIRNVTIVPEKRPNHIMWMCGNCKKETIGRTDLVKSIMNLTQVDSYGTCLHNKNLTIDYGKRVQGRSVQKIEMLLSYNFVISIENSRCDDYVTEKLWEALSYGTIPIYLGAPNIRDWLPHPDAIIHIADFPSVFDLVQYIDQVSKNETLRLKHLQWISKPYPDSFKKLLNESNENLDLFCNMCKRVVEISKNETLTYKPLQEPFKSCIKEKFNLPLYPKGYIPPKPTSLLDSKSLELTSLQNIINSKKDEEESDEDEHNSLDLIKENLINSIESSIKHFNYNSEKFNKI
ncbi:hypothetical protein ACTFIR_010676 [Dictyostelium discoideum]